MLSLTRKTDYGLVALAFLARCWRQQAGPVSAAQIAETHGLPRALLMNILKQLAHARIVTATRGAAGGYELADAPQRISLHAVATALEGSPGLVQCADGLPIVGQTCALEHDCPVRQPLRKLHHRIQAFLKETTLEDLLDDVAEPAGACCRETGVSTGKPAAAGAQL